MFIFVAITDGDSVLLVRGNRGGRPEESPQADTTTTDVKVTPAPSSPSPLSPAPSQPSQPSQPASQSSAAPAPQQPMFNPFMGGYMGPSFGANQNGGLNPFGMGIDNQQMQAMQQQLMQNPEMMRQMM